MSRTYLLRRLLFVVVTLFVTVMVIQPALAVPGSITTIFRHDNRWFHGNMFNVNIVNPMRITAFDVNIEAGVTTVSVYYRTGTYVGFETNPAAWTLMGSATVVGAGPNNRTRVNVSSPILTAGTYGFYVTVTPTFNDAASVDMFYTSGSRTYSNSNISIVTGIGVGGLFGDRAACIARGFNENPCIFLKRTWNGTIYYDTVTTPTVPPTITSAAPAGGRVGVAYNHNYTATGTTPISFTLTSGALPPGLTLTAAGVLSGTPTTTGTYTGVVTASNGVAPNATQAFSITIAPPLVPPTITSAAPGGGQVGSVYSHTYTATGTTPISFAVTSGALPPGLTLTAGGLLSGTPTTAGTYTGVVTASNGTAPNATQAFSITINPAPVAPTITSAAPAGGTVGAAYSHTYTATGTAPISFAVTSGALPPGLTLTAGGLLSGTPTTPGTYTGVVTASNGVAPNATQAFSITINAAPVAPTITSAAPAGGTVGSAYSHTYTATGTTPISFTLTSGALPPGLTLTAGGLLSGTPTTAGTYTGVVTASNGVAPNATQAFSITINPTSVPPTITSAAPAGGQVGTVYGHTYTATGTTPISFTLTSGALPPGLTLTAAGVLSGTPTTAGTYTGVVTASNGTAPNATQAFSITIAPPPAVPPTITSAAPAGGTVGVAYSHTYTATGTTPISFTLTSGALPPGLTLTAGGLLSGTPTTPGTYTGVVTASNGVAPNATQAFSITINPAPVAPTITSAAPAGGTVGAAYSHTYTATGTAPISFAVTSGALPPGLTLTAGGLLSGTPTTPGTYTGVVTASNGVAPNATQAFSITIAPSGAPGQLTTMFAHDGRYFHGNMFNVTINNPLQITAFDVNIGAGVTTVSVYYRSGTYVGFESNPAAWTLMGSAAVLGAGPNNQTRVNVSSPLLAPGTYGFYLSVTPIFDEASSVDMYYTSGSRTYSNADMTLVAGIGVGGSFGDPAACAARGFSNNPCIFLDRTWNGTIFYSVAPTAPAITSAAPAGGTVGAAYSHTYTATGTTPISFTLTSGALPPGLTLTAGGLLSGTPTTAGTYTGVVTASNGVAPNATQAFSITINPTSVPPTITSAAPAGGQVGTVYGHTYTATGTTPISFTLTSGALPPGLTLTAAGVLSGTPTTPGTYTGVVTASNGTAPNATQAFSITIAPPPAVPPTITSLAPAGGTVGVAYSHTYTATGTTPIGFTLTSGALPPGLTLTTGGLLSGTPTTPGTYTGVVTASNGTAPNATQAFSITITAAPASPTITSLAPVGGRVGSAYSHTYTATGTAPISFTVTSGALPPGLTLTAGGVLSGTPTTVGAYTGVVTASNGIAPNATQAFEISIAEVSLPGQLTTLFASNRQFHGNMFDVTVINPLQIDRFDMNIRWGTTTVSVYYRSGSYVGNETNPAAWTLLGSVTVSGADRENRTPVLISTPVLSPGVYGFYVTVIPVAEFNAAPDMFWTAGRLTVATADLSIREGIGMGGAFGDVTACIARGYPNNPCIFNDRIWNGTIYYTPVGGAPASTSLQSFSVAATEAPVITSAAPLGGTVGTGYSHSYTANGTAPIGYAVTAGSLPPGLTLTAEGLLSGTPLAAGTYTGEVTASNGTAPNAVQPFSITIVEPTVAPVITSAPPAGWLMGTAYSHSYTANGTAPISYAVTAGSLPPGLTLTAEGLLSGTPLAAGTYTGEVTASNGTAPNAVQPFSITIVEPTVAPVITSAPPPGWIVGTAYSYSYTANGTAPISYAVTAGSLPPGLTLTAEGLLSGTPLAAGTYTGEVTASNGTAPNATQPFSITIVEPTVAPAVTSGPPVDGAVGVAYSYAFTASGTAPISFVLTAGELPPGLVLTPDGLLSGTPTTPGSYSAVVTVTNGTAPDSVVSFTITIT